MTSFPEIAHPCPYLDRLDEVVEGGFCRMCRREVHDLTAMDEGQLSGFLAARAGDTCVTYRMEVKPALAAILIAASAAALVVPDAALAVSQQTARGHHRARPHHARAIPVQPIVVVTGGLPVPILDRPADPVVPLPRLPPSPPQKPD